MDYLNNLIDETDGWWSCSTHISSKKAYKNNLILLRSNLFSEYSKYERVISLYKNSPNKPIFVNCEEKKFY